MHLLQFTGLSGAGKTTIANLVKHQLEAAGQPVAIIDGHVYRQTLCAGLGFSPEDRAENIRRLAAVARGFVARGSIAIIDAIHPYEQMRQSLTRRYNAKTIWIQCPPDVLQRRDTRGLYQRALLPDGHPEKVRYPAGVNDVYENPPAADLVLHTGRETEQESVQRLLAFMQQCPAPAVEAWRAAE